MRARIGSLVLGVGVGLVSVAVAGATVTNPILYVNQVPTTAPTGTVVSIGGTHLASTKAAPRGGGLMIRYTDGVVRNLTQVAGYGESGQQGANAVAVRDPSVHWSGQKALFSMVVGAPVGAADDSVYYWQIYEVSGLGKNNTPVVTHVPNQPQDFNNIQPTYGSDDQIIFVSDRTLDGGRTLYPAIDETGEGIAVTGLWALDPADASVTIIDHSPSGSFQPFVDSYGRVIFSRWDHLQRDDEAAGAGAFDYGSEDPAAPTVAYSDIYPESLRSSGDSLGHSFDLFLPWMVNQDGSGLLTVNHIGRHEFGTEFDRSRVDSNLVDFDTPPGSSVIGQRTRAGSYLQIDEDRASPGSYIATDAISTATSAGRLVTFVAPPNANPDAIEVELSNANGLARDPTFLSNGGLLGSFATGPVITGSYGSSSPGQIDPVEIPEPSNPFRVRTSATTNLSSGTNFIPTTSVSVVNIVDGSARSFNGQLWQLQPVEVVERSAPSVSTEVDLESPETSMFEAAGVEVEALRTWLAENEMALLVARNVTARDANDKQQPYNLFVPGGVASLADAGPAYAVTDVQFFQGDYLRSYSSPAPELAGGRRITARTLHATAAENPQSAIAGSTPIGQDGSMAMIVPAGRALTWQLTDAEGDAVVRERYWLSFKAGEIRTCTNCHGTNSSDQLGRSTIGNPPLALRDLLVEWSQRHPEAATGLTAYERWAQSHLAPDATPDGDSDFDGTDNYSEFVYGTDPMGEGPAGAVAFGVRSSMADDGGGASLVLSFTRNLDAAAVRVAVESSENFSEWVEAAVIEGDSVETNGSVLVNMSATPEQTDAKVQQVDISQLVPAEFVPSRYYRLRFGTE